MNSRLRIIVTGLIAQHPLGGVTWDYVQYVLGLVRLGHDVFYIEDSGEWPYVSDSTDRTISNTCAANVRYLAAVMQRFGLGERWAYRYVRSGEWFGLSDRRRAEVITDADLVLNVSGTIARPRKYLAAKRLAYIDSDPVFTQVRLALGERKLCAWVAAHDIHFSFGESLSDTIPKTGHDWRPTRQPIVLSEWRPGAPERPAFTTIMTWASERPLLYAGRRFGYKNLQFQRYLDLPHRVPAATLEIAVGDLDHLEWQPEEDVSDRPRAPGVRGRGRHILEDAGWRVVSAAHTCPDLDSYRAYIEGSLGEWSVAKHGYVMGQSGWFSCRSACYLAAGKPVIVENTGFDSVLPVGEGILPFRTVEEAVAAIEEVIANYARHAAAARDIAVTCFDSAKVLTMLIERAMDSPAVVSPRVPALERGPQALPAASVASDAPSRR
jgi:hypothetical protein